VDGLHNAEQINQSSISHQPNRKFEWDCNASHRSPSTLALGNMLHEKSVSTLVYHYTKASTAIKHILPSGTIQLGSYATTNDPKETRNWSFGVRSTSDLDLGKYKMDELSRKLSSLLKEKTQVCCFSQDKPPLSGIQLSDILHRGYAKPRMWAQYAENHRGVCMVFNRDRLLQKIIQQTSNKAVIAGEVIYDDEPVIHGTHLHEYMINADLLESLGIEAYAQHHLKEYVQPLFFRKLKDWQDEREWRVIAFTSSNQPIQIKYGDALVGIVHGESTEFEASEEIMRHNVSGPVQHVGLIWKNGSPWYDFESSRWSPTERSSPWFNIEREKKKHENRKLGLY
jgi:hypothetical protein